ncbi:hypothetical protein SDC9_79374 [bioreactor metagenome]|uniref:Uncharacterized protein n=1 Tax=bioreactor metagenome TaxID=1076179 RepID=A0A644YXS1_9ZZZZ
MNADRERIDVGRTDRLHDWVDDSVKSEEVVEARVVVPEPQCRGVSHGVGSSLVSRFTASS